LLRIQSHPFLGDREPARTITITVDGVEIKAIEGEPLAAALLAAGIRAVRTMPETGEPRGVFTGVGRSIEELGTVDGEAHVPLMTTPARGGMVVETQRGLGDWEERA